MCFAVLGTSIEAKNVEKAFDAAHSLKGTLGNMGLTPMYEIIIYSFIHKIQNLNNI